VVLSVPSGVISRLQLFTCTRLLACSREFKELEGTGTCYTDRGCVEEGNSMFFLIASILFALPLLGGDIMTVLLEYQKLHYLSSCQYYRY